MLSLATRGYLFPRMFAQLPCGPGPSVVDSRPIVPTMSGAANLTPFGPSLSGQGVEAPRIGGASGTAPPPLNAPPSISGGGPLIPNINKKG